MSKETDNIELDDQTAKEQQDIIAMMGEKPIEVGILRTKKIYCIDWLKNAQMIKLASLLCNGKNVDDNADEDNKDSFNAILNDNKLACKAAAIYLLNGYWKIKFQYWWLWRWFYYIRQYETSQLMPVLLAGRERIPYEQYFLAASIQASVKEVLKNMTLQETENKLRELPINGDAQAPTPGNTESESEHDKE